MNNENIGRQPDRIDDDVPTDGQISDYFKREREKGWDGDTLPNLVALLDGDLSVLPGKEENV